MFEFVKTYPESKESLKEAIVRNVWFDESLNFLWKEKSLFLQFSLNYLERSIWRICSTRWCTLQSQWGVCHWLCCCSIWVMSQIVRTHSELHHWYGLNWLLIAEFGLIVFNYFIEDCSVISYGFIDLYLFTLSMLRASMVIWIVYSRCCHVVPISTSNHNLER